MTSKTNIVSPAINFSKEEIDLFNQYKKERREEHFDIKKQKRHAEAMLELYRPKWARIYKLRMAGKEIKKIVEELGVSFPTVVKHQQLAILWLRCALLNLKCKEGPISDDG